MERNEILEQVLEMVAMSYKKDVAELSEATSFKEDLGADSLDLFELVTNLEEEYNIEIPAEELEKLTTVGKVIDYLKSVNIEA